MKILFDTETKDVYLEAGATNSLSWWQRTLHKEEKKMQNVDKYREAIMGKGVSPDVLECHIAALRGHKEKCNGRECSKCKENTINWLFSEHEPTLLENGDGLKPGDWIMVSDDDEDDDGGVTWYKNRFVCYYNAMFFVVDDRRNDSFNENGTNITGWKYARLSEDGE